MADGMRLKGLGAYNRVTALALVLQYRAGDFFKMHMMPFVSASYFLLYCVSGLLGRKNFSLLLSARRAYPGEILDRLISKNLPRIQASPYVGGNHLSLDRFIILKLPVFDKGRVIEKGVIVVKFTETFEVFLDRLDVDRVTQYFYCVLEPSWAGYAIAPILKWARPEFGDVVVLCPEQDDFNFIDGLNTNLIPVRPGASDWVDDRVFFREDNAEKIYDSVYVANYNSIKRIHRYLLALYRLDIPSYRAALVCSSWGRDRERILKLIDYYDLREKIKIFEDLGQPEINVVLNQSKVNMLLSLKEGANKSIFEGFFAGTPAIVLKKNVGVNKNYINESTGVLIDDQDLERTLVWFGGEWARFSPSAWARENISPRATAKKLNALLAEIARLNGGSWMYGVYAKVNAPEMEYYDVAIREFKGVINAEFVGFFQQKGGRSSVQLMADFCDRWREKMPDLQGG